MRLSLISDLHLDYYSLHQLKQKLAGLPPAELLVIAGDVGRVTNPNYVKLLAWLRGQYSEVILVPGNHEYQQLTKTDLGSNPQTNQTDQYLQQVCQQLGIIYLQRSAVEVEGVTFLGCTLWTDCQVNSFQGSNDQRLIFGLHQQRQMAHLQDKNWLTKTLAKLQTTTKPVVVITHHLPSADLIHPNLKLKYGGWRQDLFFSPLEKLIETYQPTYWLAGHSHQAMRVKLGSTICLLNPVGYPQEKTGFSATIIEL